MFILSKSGFKTFLLCFVMFFVLSGCGPMNQETSATEAPVLLSSESVISASAKLVPKQWATLSFSGGGPDVEIFYQTGDYIEAGQTIARIKQDDLIYAVDQAKINVDRAQLAIDQLEALPAEESVAAAKVVIANAEVNYDRLDRAGARQIELDAAQAQLDSARLSLDAIEAGATDIQKRSAQLDLEAASQALTQAENALTFSEIKMPFDGTIVEIYLQNFEFASPSQPVFLVADLSKMQIETTDLSEVDVALLKLGDTAVVSFDALPDLSFTGIVQKIALKAASGAGVNYVVTLDVDEIPDSLRWGMTAFVEFKGD